MDKTFHFNVKQRKLNNKECILQESFHINSEQAELICSDRNKNSGFWLPWGLAGKEHRGNLEEVKGSLQLAERRVR